MEIDYQKLRIDGVYQQDAEGRLMLRIKIPAGLLSSEQAGIVAGIAESYVGGRLHLTSRGSIELHGLAYDDLAAVGRRLAAVGLTSRGACGGAVRGVSCSTSLSANFPVVHALARKLHRHFTGNPHFEGIPKKFKIGVEAGYAGARHLIQDLGIVHVGMAEGSPLYDVWAAGGLGREPQPAFLLAEKVSESRLLPLAEGVIRLYMAHAPKGKRLKHVVREMGEKAFRDHLAGRVDPKGEFPLGDPFAPLPAPFATVEAGIFAGELSATSLRDLAQIASDHGGGFLAFTADQNVAFFVVDSAAQTEVQNALARLGFTGDTPEERIPFRICPGSHECKMGLAPTRNIARRILDAVPPSLAGKSWAISGCPNSCSQPQLADVGIVTRKIVKDDDGNRAPRFDLLRRTTEGFGQAVACDLDADQLIETLETI